MIAERAGFEVPYAELQRAAASLIDGGSQTAARAWLAELSQHLEKVTADGDIEAVADWSARLDRLDANLPDGELTGDVRGYLASETYRLDRAVAALSQRRDVEERARRAEGVRERVLRMILDQPEIRSSEIAESLGVTRSQVSRALRELQQRGLVARAESRAADHDNRVHRYVGLQSPKAA